MARPLQLELRPRTWGGRRPGAGRKPSGRKVGVRHRPRPPHERRHPVHVTLRAHRKVPSLREERLVLALRHGLAKGSRGGFRILHFSIQTDHVHLMAEAADGRALSRGIQGLGIRLAKAKPRPRQARQCMERPLSRACAQDSARGAKRPGVRPPKLEKAHPRRRRIRSLLLGRMVHRLEHGDPDDARRGPIAAPRTWLAAVGWRRHGLIRPDEAPAKPTTSKRASRRWK